MTITPSAYSNHETYNYGVNGYYKQGNGNSAVTFDKINMGSTSFIHLDVSAY